MNFVAVPPVIEEPEPALDLMPLASTFWYLSAFENTPILPGMEITAGFDINEGGVTGEISGSGGCNAYNATIGENFAIGPIASTQKACQGQVMDQETTYFAWLSSAYGYNRAGDQLLISTANGVLTFNSTPILDQTRELQNTNWYLISYESFTAIAGSNPTARFATDGHTVSGTTGCNDYNGAYSTQQGNKLAISGISNTLSACASDALTRQEEIFLRLMPAAVSYTVSGTQMQIVTVDGGTMMAGPTNNISIGPLRTTNMACSEEIMVQEQAYLANLESAGSYTVSSSTLTLTTAGGPLVYDAAIAVPLPAVLQ